MRFTRSAPLTGGGTISGNLTVTEDLSVIGNTAITVNEVIQGTSTIDVTDTEALLVRKNGDGGDIFIVDTNTPLIKMGGNLTFTHDIATISSTTGLLQFRILETGQDMLFDAGAKFKFRDTDSSNATRVAIDSSNGNLSIGTDTATNNLHIEADSGDEGITIHSAGDTSNAVILDANRSGADSGIGNMLGKWNGTLIGYMGFFSGADTTNKDDGVIKFATTPSGGSATLALTIGSDQHATFAQNINLGDDKALTLGADGDAQIWNDGSNTYIRNNTSDQDIIFRVNDGGSANTEVMRIDGATANVGIGTDSPASTTGFNTSNLTIAGTAPSLVIADTGQDKLQICANNGLFLFMNDSDDRVFFSVEENAPANSLYIDNNGHIGIGTNSPDTNLSIADVSTSTGINIDTYSASTGNVSTLSFRKSTGTTIGTPADTGDGEEIGLIQFLGVNSSDAFDAGARIYAKQNGASSSGAVPTDLYLDTYSTGINTNQLVLHHDGNVGIGVNDPKEKLHVSNGNDSNSGNITFLIGGTEGTNARTGRIIKNTSSPYEMTIRANDFSGSGDLILNDDGGNVGIGKDPDTILDIDSGTIGESSAENAGIRITGQRNGNITALTMRHEAASGGASVSNTGIGMHFQGYDGSNSYHNMGAIYVRSAEDSVSDNDSPGYMTFHTTPNGSDTIQERIRIDSSGNTNLNSNYIINEQGKPNHVANTMSSPYYRFDAVDDKIVPSSAFGLINTDFSISCWVRHTSRTDGIWEAIYSQKITEIWFGFGRNSDAQGRVRLHVGGGSDYADTPNGVVPEGVWTHVAATWDGSSAKIYVNGVSQTITVSGTLNNPETEDTYKIGGHSVSNDNQYLGELNNLSFWNIALSETEVKELYSGSSVPFKYKGANQTTLVANGTDWTGGSPPTSWAVYKATATSAGSGFSGDCVAVTADTSGSANYLYQTRTLTVGKYYRLSAYVKSGTSGNETFEISFRANTLGAVLTSVTGTSSGSWVKHSVDWLCTQSAITVSLAKTTTTSGTMLFDSAVVVPIGAVAEYDGSSAGEKIWGDKSGNDFHGTVTGASVENTPYDSGTEYEEGTYTVTLTPSGSGSITVDSTYDTASYTKIGRQVTVMGHVDSSAISSPVGYIKVNVPFTIGDGAELSQRGSGSVFIYNSSANIQDFGVFMSENEAYFRIYLTTGAGLGLTSANQIDASTSIQFAVTYFV